MSFLAPIKSVKVSKVYRYFLTFRFKLLIDINAVFAAVFIILQATSLLSAK